MKKIKITSWQRRKMAREYVVKYLNEHGKIPVLFKEKISEADICYELRKRIESIGFIVRSEFTVFMDKKNKKSRFDLAVFDEKKEIVCIVEVKDTKGSNKNCSQFQKYAMFDCYLLFCFGYDEIEKCVNILKQLR